MLHFADNVPRAALRCLWLLFPRSACTSLDILFAVGILHVGGTVDGVSLDVCSRSPFLLDNLAFLITWGSTILEALFKTMFYYHLSGILRVYTRFLF